MLERTLTIEHEFGATWCAEFGTGDTPLIVVHGGPSAAHDYLIALKALAANRRVIFYDQMGCGRSTTRVNADLLSISHFVSELEAVRAGVDAQTVDVIGHSWGGFVAIKHALANPDRVRRLVLASTAASAEDINAATTRRVDSLEVDHARWLHEWRSGMHPDADSRSEAFLSFHRRFTCRLGPWPEEFLSSARHQAGDAISARFVGDSAPWVNGRLVDWSRKDDLASLECTTLVTAGVDDHLGAECWRPLIAEIPQSRAAIFGRSSHSAHLEEPTAYLVCLERFLSCS